VQQLLGGGCGVPRLGPAHVRQIVPPLVVRYTPRMSKRLQVVVGDAELERYQRTAQACGQTVSEWVRQALRAAERRTSDGDVEAKLAVIRKAASYGETGGREVDIDTMLAEIEAGRLAEIEAGLAGADV
jgi:hypothetical protein